jgi:hypothetical protein
MFSSRLAENDRIISSSFFGDYFMSPSSPQFAKEIARLMRDPESMRSEWERPRNSGRHGHYDSRQPRIPAGHPHGGRWTDADGGGPASDESDAEHRQLVQFSPNRLPVRPGHPIVALLSLFAALSARNTPEQRAIFEFNAKEFLRDPHGELDRANVNVLNRDEVENVCRKLEDVQRRTDRAADAVKMNIKRTGLALSGSQLGTAVHAHLKTQIDALGDPNYRAEVSYWKEDEARYGRDEARYGRKDSIRIDVLENAGRRLVCVYDIKTGQSRRSGLSQRRMTEIAQNVLKAYPHVQRIVITEVRPSR